MRTRKNIAESIKVVKKGAKLCELFWGFSCVPCFLNMEHMRNPYVSKQIIEVESSQGRAKALLILKVFC